MKNENIFGYDWDTISDIQQKTHNPQTVDMSTDGRKPATSDDIHLFESHGENGLRDMEYYGVIDRLKCSGWIK